MRISAATLPSCFSLTIGSTLLLSFSSFGAGATRNRGGVLDALHLGFLAYGHGAALSNIGFFLGLVLIVGTWALAGRRYVFRTLDSESERLYKIRRLLLAQIICLIPAAPMLSRDVYSYLMQGAMIRDGFDPYTQGAAIDPGPMLHEVSFDWRNTTTPYGPLHLWLGDAITKIVGDNVTLGVLLYKFVSIAGFFAIMWAIPRIAVKLGGDPIIALWLGVANPVMVLHMVGGMHNESVMVGLVSLGIYLSLKKHFFSGIGLIGLAVSLKVTAAIAVPFIVWLAVRTYGGQLGDPWGRRIISFFVSGAIALSETIAVVSLVTWLSGSSWGWLSQISGNSKVINPLALPSLLASLITPFFQLGNEDFSFNTPLAIFRTVSMGFMLLGLVIVWWLFRKNARTAVAGTAAAYLVAFIFNSVTLPWYYASVISLVGTVKPPHLLVRWVIGLSIVVTMAFSGSGNHMLYNLAWMVVSGLAAWVMSDLCVGPRRRVSLTPTPAVS
ncbi:alpha-(1-_6)-mannopyranosyltransferase A [Corynebacterium sp. 3HC-13]|uniref:alpha-(1->6)-mannopyranosyltransferase A n=1 Tax=Corynebacterium poyangense TaxID=2684405 RepID=UPI001CCF5AC2|nr:alpha-(1->6)-mannopyranosyltransferase A [Corynebacterium poyangense]MBZ8178161.1 alpha-(1->6)-mannopyranosyltransferase A [Corynebacterium poyangense]